MRKGRRERIEKGRREDHREKTKRQNDNLKRRRMRCSHCFFKSSGYDKLELKHQNLVFTS